MDAIVKLEMADEEAQYGCMTIKNEPGIMNFPPDQPHSHHAHTLSKSVSPEEREDLYAGEVKQEEVQTSSAHAMFSGEDYNQLKAEISSKDPSVRIAKEEIVVKTEKEYYQDSMTKTKTETNMCTTHWVLPPDAAHVIDTDHDNTDADKTSARRFIDAQTGSCSEEDVGSSHHSHQATGELHGDLSSTSQIISGTSQGQTDDKSRKQASKFMCMICDKYFISSGNLKKHLKIHSEYKPYECEICGKSFIRKGDLQKHERIHTGDKPYECHVCKKSFTSSSQLTVHERIHSGDKPYVCKVCEKSFTHNSDLVSHSRTHTGVKPFECSTCGKTFGHRSSWRTHKQVHSEEKRFHCEVCGKSFGWKNSLIIHNRVHTGEKPYACKVCDKSFACSSDLSVHNRVHTNVKPYECEFCGKSFAHISDHIKHKRVHTSEKPYKCTICGKAFTASSSLKKHEQTQH